VITACVSVLGLVIKRQSERRLDQAEERLDREQSQSDARLRLDAAMRAGTLFNDDGRVAAPAAAASGLLALTELGRADLAVALLVDLWDDGHTMGTRPTWTTRTARTARTARFAVLKRLTVVRQQDQANTELGPERLQPGDEATTTTPRVSNEVAVQVIDAALRCGRPSAELVAAELLCRNARRLDIRQSLHWPSAVDGQWDESFGNKTKLLVVDALVRMALTRTPDESALQSLAVRLFGISDGDTDSTSSEVSEAPGAERSG
jgi:hypothetical protein